MPNKQYKKEIDPWKALLLAGNITFAEYSEAKKKLKEHLGMLESERKGSNQ